MSNPNDAIFYRPAAWRSANEKTNEDPDAAIASPA